VGVIKRILGQPNDVSHTSPPQASDVPGAALSRSINRFAIDTYGKLSSDNSSSNLLLSPFSIASALALILTGARGITARQLADALHLDKLGDRLRDEYRAIRTLHERFDSWDKTDIRIANGLWGHIAYEFSESFRADVQDVFGGEIRDADFSSEAESVRREVNDWVAKTTNRRIRDLLESGAISKLTRLVVVNAFYFQDKWLDEFDPDKTSDEPFTLSDGRPVETPMMRQMNRFTYGETIDEQVLTIPYQSGFNMTVVLPKKVDGIADVEKRLRSAGGLPWEEEMTSREVVLTLPRFRIETKTELSSQLKNMGVTEIFDPSTADLSGMTTHEPPERSEPLYIEDIFHQTFINVDETGTEAAAATATMPITASLKPPPPPVIFTADHPFLFLIRTNKTGLILFMGRVTDPTR
jgi:serpin B